MARTFEPHEIPQLPGEHWPAAATGTNNSAVIGNDGHELSPTERLHLAIEGAWAQAEMKRLGIT